MRFASSCSSLWRRVSTPVGSSGQQLSLRPKANSSRNRILSMMQSTRSKTSQEPKVFIPKVPVFSYPIEISDDGLTAVAVLPGYGFGDLNRGGQVELFSCLRADESVRMRMINDPKVPTRGLSDKLFMLVSHHYQFAPGMYNEDNLFRPIRHTHNVIHVGSSSMHYGHTNQSVQTGELLHHSRSLLVFTDQISRKGEAAPEALSQAFKKRDKTGLPPPLERFEPLSKPSSGVHQGHIQIQPDDLDYYFHTNHASYPRLVYNVGCTMAIGGKLTQFLKDLAFYRIKDMKCLNTGETNLGDLVTVFVWECDGKVLNFIAEKNGAAVFHCVMQFYEDDDESKL